MGIREESLNSTDRVDASLKRLIICGMGYKFYGGWNYLNRFTIYSKHQYHLILELCTIIDHYGSPYKKYKPIKCKWSRHRVLHSEDKHTDSPFVDCWSYCTHKGFSSYTHNL
jgi:hypothetical protein